MFYETRMPWGLHMTPRERDASACIRRHQAVARAPVHDAPRQNDDADVLFRMGLRLPCFLPSRHFIQSRLTHVTMFLRHRDRHNERCLKYKTMFRWFRARASH